MKAIDEQSSAGSGEPEGITYKEVYLQQNSEGTKSMNQS
jgi:hypothetical protein